MKLTVRMKVVDDKTGEVVVDQECKSFLNAIIGLLCESMGQALVNFTVDDTGSAARTVWYAATTNWRVDAAAGAVVNGIVCGTGTTAITVSDDALDTLIAEGAGAGQLNYGAVGMTNMGIAAGTASFTITRTVVNNTGANIIVNEVGIYVRFQDETPASRYFCLERTLTTFTVNSGGGSRTITYTIGVTV